MRPRAAVDLVQFLEAARVFNGENRFILGTFECGVTVYRQQIRALNLVYAFAEARGLDGKEIILPKSRIAVVGGGAFGVTAAAAAAYAGFKVRLFERHQFLLHLQRGCSTRWIHPRFYDWPDPTSESRMARLPMLDWAASTAATVASELDREFRNLATQKADSLQFVLEASEIDIRRRGELFEVHCRTPVGRDIFACEVILYAVGLGTERVSGTTSYWRNDQLGQTDLEFTGGNRVKYVVSGIGDGGLVVLFRLTVRDFKHESIFQEVFGPPDSSLLERLRGIQRAPEKAEGWLFDQFGLLVSSERALSDGIAVLRTRQRSDTDVTLNGKAESLRIGLDLDRISLGNALLTYCLFRIDAFRYEPGELNSNTRELRDVPESSTKPSWLSEAANVIVRHGTDRRKALVDIGCGDEAIELVRKQSNTGTQIYPDGWWGRYTRPSDAVRDNETFTPVEFVPPALMSHATTFVCTLGNVLGVLIDKRGRGTKGKINFRVALHRLTRFDGHEVFQQITPYAGRVESTAGLGRFFGVEGGIVGLACKTGSLVVAEKKDEKKFARIWELTALHQSGAKTIKSYVDSVLACPFFAPQTMGGKQYVTLVLFVDSADPGFFNAEVREVISAACRGFVNILESLHGSGALRPIVSFYPGFQVQQASKRTKVIGELKKLGVSFKDATDRRWKKDLTFRSLHSLDLEVGPSMKIALRRGPSGTRGRGRGWD